MASTVINSKENLISQDKEVEDVKTIEVVSKSTYEELERKYNKLERSHEKTTQRVEDLEDTIRSMRWQDTCKNGFIFNYLKPRHRPKMSEDGEKELYSEDGRHWYPLNGITLQPTGFAQDRFSKRLVKLVPGYNAYPVFGYMGYNKPMDNDRYWKLEELAEKVAGNKSRMNFSDPKEDEEFDRIGRNMA